MKKIYILILFFACFIPNLLTAQVAGDYRTINSSTSWATLAIWETFNGTAWVAAAAVPTSANANVITIRTGHTVNVSTNMTIDQVVVETGATLSWGAGTLTIGAGAGVDLLINGSFWDNRGAAGTSIAFAGGATWQMGLNGSLIRSAGNSSNNWQAAYEGGITNIPATSNWILRRTGAQVPALSSTTPASGSVYPNLIIENNTATAWAVSFTGTTAPQTIKGNLDIGGSGSGAGVITFTNSNTHATPTLVQGNMTVKNTHIYNNNGTGTTIQGNLTVNGTIAYDANDGRQLNFTGGNAQSISGTGTLNVLNMTVNKSANDLTLNKAITVNNLLTLTSGKIFTTSTNLLTIANGSTVSGGSDLSFISGPIRKIGNTAFTFPVGKGSNYQELTLGVNAAGGGTFWTEGFGTATCAAAGTVANGFSSGNGAWTQTDAVNGSAANEWYVSPTEANMGLGGCGDGCLGNAALNNSTLHLSALGGLCSSPDCGAAYNATDATNITDKRVESPVINCSGRSNITLSFLYMANGQGVVDNCIVWYHDGTSWAVLIDPASSATCGPLCGFGICQGVWTNFSTILPASANNNPNVRIGFQWINNGDGAGSDPSFAVDDITLAEVVPLDIFTCEFFQSSPKTDIGTAMDPTIFDLDDVEYWILDRNTGSVGRTVTLSWDGTSDGISDLNGLQVCRWDGSMWKNHGNGGTTGSTSPTPCNGPTTCGTIISSNPINSFSPFAIGVPMESLPIELINFSATPIGKKVQLDWVVAQEIDHSHYDVQHSADAIEFESFKTIDGVGNTNQTQYYSCEHLRPVEGFNYYRLGIVSTSGQVEYSPIVVAEIKGGIPNFVLAPNPARDAVTVSWNNQALTDNWTVEIIDAQGRTVQSLLLTGHSQNISVADLPNGLYWFRFTSRQDVIVQKLIKQ